MGIQSTETDDQNQLQTGMQKLSASCLFTHISLHTKKPIKAFFAISVILETNFPEMMNRYKQLLTYIRSAVTRNYSEKSINSILDYISTSKQAWVDTLRLKKIHVAGAQILFSALTGCLDSVLLPFLHY